MIDTHSHLYSEEFDNDLDSVIQRAKSSGVQHIILPNIDSESLPRMLSVEEKYPDFCTAAIGLHPTSVKENYVNELNIIKTELSRRKYKAIGEIGIDLYWDKTFYTEQVIAFKQQIDWALEYNLPVIIHVRDSFNETMSVLSEYKNKGLKGVFHSFGGTLEEAKQIIDFRFKIGINGIITFKNSNLSETLAEIDLSNIVLETDSPYLTPTPHRGKRNESSYINYILNKLTTIYNLSTTEIDKTTTNNAINLFDLSTI